MKQESLKGEDFQIWTNECEKVRSTKGFIKEFGFQQHPAVLKDRDAMIIKGQKPKEVMCREKTCKEIFYRGDLETLFDKYGNLRQAIQNAAKALTEDMDRGVVDPLQEAKDPLAEPQIAAHGSSVKFALKHFQAMEL